MTNQEYLSEALKELGLQPDVTIVDEPIKFRWTLRFDKDSNYPDFPRGMIKLERMLQAKLKRPIDLRLEKREDRNKRDGKSGRK